MDSTTPKKVARRQKIMRFVSTVRFSTSSSSRIFSRRTMERLNQLRNPRSTRTAASAKRNEPTSPHCMRKNPYAKPETAMSAAKIQKTIMGVKALYPGRGGVPSRRCNGPLASGGRRSSGEEEYHHHACEGQQVAWAVGLWEDAAQ